MSLKYDIKVGKFLEPTPVEPPKEAPTAIDQYMSRASSILDGLDSACNATSLVNSQNMTRHGDGVGQYSQSVVDIANSLL